MHTGNSVIWQTLDGPLLPCQKEILHKSIWRQSLKSFQQRHPCVIILEERAGHLWAESSCLLLSQMMHRAEALAGLLNS